MSIIEDFLREIDARWTWPAPSRVPLRIIGSTALMLQTSYVRGTKDSDLLETIELSAETQQRLLAVAGAGTDLYTRRRLHLEIVPNGIPFLPWPPTWHLLDGLNRSSRHFELGVLDVVDVVVSKLKRLNDNDLTDIAAMADLGLVPHDALLARFRARSTTSAATLARPICRSTSPTSTASSATCSASASPRSSSRAGSELER